MAQLAPGPLGHHIGDVAPLMVALNYFTQLEVYLAVFHLYSMSRKKVNYLKELIFSLAYSSVSVSLIY